MAPPGKLPGLWNLIMTGFEHKIILGIGIILFLLSVHSDSVEAADVEELYNATVSCDNNLICDSNDTSNTSSPVTSLTFLNLTSNSVTVTWTLSENCNGDIAEFFVQVFNGAMECVQLYTLTCSSCPRNSTQTTPSSCQESFDGSTFTEADVEIGSGHVFRQQITSLAPYTFYKVNIYAYNDAGKGKDFEQNFTTLEDVAHNIKSIQVIPGRDGAAHQVYLNVTFVSGVQTGLTNFTVTLINNNDDVEMETNYLTGYSNTTVVFTDLLAFQKYKVSAYAETIVGRSPENISSEIVTTSVNKPGSPRISIKGDSIMAIKFTLTLDCPPQNERNGTIASVIITKTSINNSATNTFQFNMSSECKSTLQSDNLGLFTVSQMYSFSAKVKNQEFISDASSIVSFFAAPKAPIFEEEMNKLIESPPHTALSETSVQVKVDATRLTDASQGEITIVGLIVCIQSDQNPCEDSTRTKRSIQNTDFYIHYTIWAQSEAGNFNSTYRATPTKWLPNSQSDTYTIGSNSDCPKGVNTYCNGPLPSGQVVVVTAFSCTSGGCAESLPYVSRTESSDSSDNAALIAGIVVGVLVALVIAVLFVVFLLRRRRENLNWMERHQLQIRSSKKIRAIPIRKFKETVVQYHENKNLLFQEEFEYIKSQSELVKGTANAAWKEENKTKSRTVLVLPYDHSRVILQDEDDDFINANYIPGLNSSREYIAAQGPMQVTISHFWRMVWEQKSTVIVMLSELIERYRPTVSLYWPETLNEPISYGEIQVEMTNFLQLNKYIIRNFRIAFGNYSRHVTQFFIAGWWDFRANLTLNDVLEFVQLVRKEAPSQESGPVIVHCSAGVGRTGTFIALDYFIQYIDKHGLDADIDVFSYVMSMRENRPLMVMAEFQYICIFDALVEVIDRKLKAEQEQHSNNNPPCRYIDVTEESNTKGEEDGNNANQAFAVGDSENGSPSKPTTEDSRTDGTSVGFAI